MNCAICGRKITKAESFSHEGKTLCEDDYIKALSKLNERECDPWATYLSAQERGGSWPKTTDNLTQLQKDMFNFIKGHGRVTRDGIAAKFPLPEEELTLHLNVLMHSELVKERSEAGVMYLIAVPVPRE